MLLVLLAAALLMFAGYSWGRSSGLEAAREADGLGAPRRPGVVQVVVLTVLGVGCLAAAVLLQGEGVRMPVPARLDELATRAEAAAIDRAGGAEAPPDASVSRG